MRFGCNLSAIAAGYGGSAKAALERLAQAANAAREAGFDYAEWPADFVAGLNEADFAEAAAIVRECGLPAPIFNRLVPDDQVLVGPEADEQATFALLEHTLERAARLGGRLVVFGSGKARSVPAGFDKDMAAEQLSRFLERCGKAADEHGLLIAVLAMNRKETNMLKRIEDVLELIAGAYVPNLRVAADTVHMHVEREDPDILTDAVEMGLMAHLYATGEDGGSPGVGAGETGAGAETSATAVVRTLDWVRIFGLLKEAGYEGDITLNLGNVEPEQFAEEGKAALEFVRSAWTSA